ncbi:flagellar biosynthesis protein FlaG [Helicobacter anseris]|uniref:Flagellar biosynthesis protein FlaG n=1 Tax=Helicobacter anseris TaxID=375926 RepID=A0A3D8J9J2_9HELI|nr:FlaG family protein [Helicobacter anseris]RDU73534.1 flagellar biosynthesis protein FlaG [Helicobacter anseris]
MIDSTQTNNSMLQKQLIDLASSAGKPVNIAKQQEAENNRKDKQVEHLKQELIETSRALNQEMKRINTDINFSYNDDIRGLVVTVKEIDGNKVIREIPSKEAIELMKKMHDIVGLIFDKKG